MRIRFFAPVQEAAPIVTPKQIDEESMSETTSEAEDSTAGEDSNLSMESIDLIELDDGTLLPEMDIRQADHLKRLLLSPLEPDTDF